MNRRITMRLQAIALCIVMITGSFPAIAAERIVLGTFSGAASWTDRWQPQVQYCSAQTGIEVEYLYIPSGTYSEKILLMAAVGDVPDLLLVPPERVASLVGAGLVEDLEPWVREKNLDQRYWIPSLIAATQFHGITIGLPAYVINYTYAYNEDIFAQHGITPPAITDWVTWDQVRDIARKATRDTDGDGTPEIWGFHNGTSFVQVLAFIRQAGGAIFTPEGFVQFNTQPVRDGVEYQLGLINDRLNAPNASIFLEGKVASIRFGSGSIVSHLQAKERVNLGVASGIMGKVKSDVSYVTPWVMPAMAKQKDAAWRYMTCMVSREAQAFVSERGVVPMRRDARISEDRIEILTGLIYNLEAAVGYPYHVENEYVQQAFDQAMKQVWAGNASPLTVLESLDRTVNAYLAEVLK
jgi:ABC-type glycerol-3-phosphate transport system substrate-binding protein